MDKADKEKKSTESRSWKQRVESEGTPDQIWVSLEKTPNPGFRPPQLEVHLKSIRDPVRRAAFERDFVRLLERKLERVELATTKAFGDWTVWELWLRKSEIGQQCKLAAPREFLLAFQVALLRKRWNESDKAGMPWEVQRGIVQLTELNPLERRRRLAAIDAEEKRSKEEEATSHPRFESKRWVDREAAGHWPYAASWFVPQTQEKMQHHLAVGRKTLKNFLQRFSRLNPDKAVTEKYLYPVEAGQRALLAWFQRPRWHRCNRKLRLDYLLATVERCAQWEPKRLDELLQLLRPAIKKVKKDFGDSEVQSQLDKVVCLATPPPPPPPLAGGGISALLGSLLGPPSE